MDSNLPREDPPKFLAVPPTYANHWDCKYHVSRQFDFRLLPPCNVFYFLAARVLASDEPQYLNFLQSITDASLLGELHKVEALHKAAQSKKWSIPIQIIATAATERGHADILQYCLDKGAKVDNDINVASFRGSSPGIYSVLLSTSSWPRYPDTMSSVLQRDLKKGCDVVRFLLDHGATIGVYSLSMTASADGTTDTLELLLDRGAQLHDSGALQSAALYDCLANVKFLLSKGARIDEIPANNPGDERECDNGTALHKAVYGSAVDVVEYLLAKGANMTILDQLGRTAMMIAEERRNEEKMKKIIDLLKHAEAKL